MNAIIELEKRFEIKLPRSYKEYMMANGTNLLLDSVFGKLFNLGNIDYFKVLSNEFYLSWTRDNIDVDDTLYFIYGDGQESYNYRTKYFHNSIQISELFDGAVVLINPNIKFEDEYEIMALANWLPGVARFKSFNDLRMFIGRK
jgi:hypothetical protein